MAVWTMRHPAHVPGKHLVDHQPLIAATSTLGPTLARQSRVKFSRGALRAYAEGSSTGEVYWRRRIGASPTSAERTASTPTSVESSSG
jgi:hypothetical protein